MTIFHSQNIKSACKEWLFAMINDFKNNTLVFIKNFHTCSKIFFINCIIAGLSHCFESDHSDCEWGQMKHKFFENQ